jgi:hypothetical protein
MEALRAALYDILAADHPMTVRQVFYRMVSQGAIGLRSIDPAARSLAISNEINNEDME